MIPRKGGTGTAPFSSVPHNNERLYFGSQRLWRSEDKGNSWTPVSGDLTTNQNRYELEMIGRVWSTDALYDNGAMSKYATLTAISESPKVEGLLYVGSDDGLIQISENGGQQWRKSGNLPKVPSLSFINDVEASSHDPNTVFAVADAHKLGDYSPYLFMSTDRGRNWQSIAGDLPEGTIVWVIKQDHIDPDLLFIGTEYGIYFSHNRGTNWIKFTRGVPTISFRDIELHPRDNDLVGATFGRGFYVLDDYSCLRGLSGAVASGENALFPVRDAWWYIPNAPLQAKGMPTLGSTSYVAENPPFGAVFTYYLADIPKTGKQERQEAEKLLREQNESIPFPGWDNLKAEARETEPGIFLLVKDENGNSVRWLKGPVKKGMTRVSWDLRFAPPDPVNLTQPAFKPPWAGDPQGPLAAPGKYTVELYLFHEGKLVVQGIPQAFNVRAVPTAPAGTDFKAVAEFQQKTSELSRQISGANRKMGEAGERLRHMKAALINTPKAASELFAKQDEMEQKLSALRIRLTGDPIYWQYDESSVPSISARVGRVIGGHWDTRQNPTAAHLRNIEIASGDFEEFRKDLAVYMEELAAYEAAMEKAGAPWTPGRKFE